MRDGRVVKGTNFEGIKDVADPVEMARLYNAAGADELVFYDITASFEGRALFTDILTRVAGEIFIPLTVGGGINTLEDFDRVLKCGADKVSVNSGALKDPGLIPAAAQRYGDQCVVLSADVKRVNGQFRVFAKGGREDTGRDALDWISWCAAHGAGEICLNSIDTDGVRNGFDLEMLDAVAARVNIRIVGHSILWLISTALLNSSKWGVKSSVIRILPKGDPRAESRIPLSSSVFLICSTFSSV